MTPDHPRLITNQYQLITIAVTIMGLGLFFGLLYPLYLLLWRL